MLVIQIYSLLFDHLWNICHKSSISIKRSKTRVLWIANNIPRVAVFPVVAFFLENISQTSKAKYNSGKKSTLYNCCDKTKISSFSLNLTTNLKYLKLFQCIFKFSFLSLKTTGNLPGARNHALNVWNGAMIFEAGSLGKYCLAWSL